MQPALKEIKKELVHLGHEELAGICLRLARYKKENKELLSYLLFHADDPSGYTEMVKASLEDEFAHLNAHDYYSTKSLRKILRTLGRHSRYMASKEAETELLLWFCQNFLAHANLRSSYKPLRTLFTRQLQKVLKLISSLHEDLQHDFRQESDALLTEAIARLKGFSAKDLKL